MTQPPVHVNDCCQAAPWASFSLRGASAPPLPDLVTAPGEILLEKLQELGISQAELAGRIGRTRKMVNEIVKGKAPILSETALQLERVLSIPARFWSNLEAQYRESLARQEERTRLRNTCNCLKATRQEDGPTWVGCRLTPTPSLPSRMY